MLIGIMRGRYRPYGRNPLALWPRLIGVAREKYARFQSPSHQSPHPSALWPKLVSIIADGHRPYGRSSSALRMSLIALLAKSYVRCVQDCGSENPHPDAPPMRTPGLACDPSTPYRNEGPEAPRPASSACKFRFDPMNRCVALRRPTRRVVVGPTRWRIDGRPQ